MVPSASARGTSRRCSRRSKENRRSGVISSLLDLLQAPARQASALQETEHRPWPIPPTSWLIAQTLEEQLFAHYPVPADELRSLVPESLALDEHSGSGWLGVTPFAVDAARIRGLLPVPRVSHFLQLNVRTYVTRDGKPGIWFFSLDASSQLAVEAARRLYRLPYYHANISLRRRGRRIVYDCSRDDGKAFSTTYEPAGAVFQAQPGSLEHFLVERYCLY